MISYDGLFHILIDRHISVSDLRRSVGLAPNTMTRLRKGLPVDLMVLYRICSFLGVGLGDVCFFQFD